jgi:predicted TIM-barrel enzyme
MRDFISLGERKAVLGMIHLQPLPGTLLYKEGSFNQTLDLAVQSARALYDGGADGCLVQTVDRIYSVKDESDPARTAAMGLIVHAIVQATGEEFQVGVQLMRNALKASLAVAKVAGGSFIRAGTVVGMTLTAHGMVEANPLEVMEYRSKINAGGVKLLPRWTLCSSNGLARQSPPRRWRVARNMLGRMPCPWGALTKIQPER